MYQEALRQRLLKATRALDAAAVPYALIGGNAVGHYVGQVAPSAVRSTADVDLLLRREDLERAQECLKREGFVYRKAARVHMFMDGPSPRECVHVVMAGEKVREDYLAAAPGLDRVERAPEGFAVIPFERLVLMKLTSFCLKDRVHLLDMIEVGLLPGDAMAQLPGPLRERLQGLVDNPED